jgi:F0F1-type ATP synthase assembly protein I
MNADGKPDSEAGSPESDDRSAIAKSLDLAYQLMAICAMFALPAVGGFYLDKWLGTGLLLTVAGLAFGLATAILQFMKLLSRLEQNDSSKKGNLNGKEKRG